MTEHTPTGGPHDPIGAKKDHAAAKGLLQFSVEFVDHDDFPTDVPKFTVYAWEFTPEAAEVQARNLIHAFADRATSDVVQKGRKHGVEARKEPVGKGHDGEGRTAQVSRRAPRKEDPRK